MSLESYCNNAHIYTSNQSVIAAIKINQERESDRQDFVKIACGNVAYESSDIEMVSLEAI